MVGMAQLASAPDCGSGGRGFKSLHPPFNGPSPSGKAQDFDSCIRWFKSSRSSSNAGNIIVYGPLAQVVEHLTFNQVVRGSSPRWLTRKEEIFGFPFLLSVYKYLMAADNVI